MTGQAVTDTTPAASIMLELAGLEFARAEIFRGLANDAEARGVMLSRSAAHPTLNPADNDLLSVKEAAALVGCHPGTLRRRGYQARRHGRQLKYRRGDLLAHGAPVAAGGHVGDAAPRLLSRGAVA